MGQHIAIIDSDPGVTAVLCEVLADEGYEPHPFHTAALTVKDIGALAPDAIILDVSAHGPGNGWSLLSQLRRDVSLGTTPILPCSTDPSRRAGVPIAATYGDDEVLAKPFDLDDLLDRLRDLVCEVAAAEPAGA